MLHRVFHITAQLERQLQQSGSLRHDNETLRQNVQEYQQKLQQCQVTIGESQAELRRLEHVARKQQVSLACSQILLNKAFS